MVFYVAFLDIMGRRKKAVEGLVLDLTELPEEGDVDMEAYIATHTREPAPPAVKKEKKEKKVRKMGKKTSGYVKANSCEVCAGSTIGSYKIYEGRVTCGLCRNYLEKKVTPETVEFLRETNSRPCTFCGAVGVVKNYDHKDIFNKTGSICIMVDTGCSYEEIRTEVEKCQVVCVPCHRKITKYEHKCGFIKKKRVFNKKKRAGEDVEALREEYSKEYLTIMEPFYEELRALHGSKGVE